MAITGVGADLRRNHQKLSKWHCGTAGCQVTAIRTSVTSIAGWFQAASRLLTTSAVARGRAGPFGEDGSHADRLGVELRAGGAADHAMAAVAGWAAERVPVH